MAKLRLSLNLPIILVTHDMTEVQLLADSLCLMYRGNSLQQGPVAKVIDKPVSRQIARLVGHQNLFNVTVISIHSKHTVYQMGDLAPFEGPPLSSVGAGDKASLLFAPSAIQIRRVDGKYSSSDVNLQTSDETGIIEEAGAGPITLEGVVQEMIMLGDELSIRLHLHKVPKSLRFKISKFEAAALGLELGCEVDVSINSNGIHAMQG